MPSLRRLPARTACSFIWTRSVRSNRFLYLSTSSIHNHDIQTPISRAFKPPHKYPTSSSPRSYSTSTSSISPADTLIEEIQEQYFTARDEFEIASEETEKKTVYAEKDRAAAREELDKLKEMYREALGGSEGEEIKRRIGQRIRELDNAVVALEERALED